MVSLFDGGSAVKLKMLLLGGLPSLGRSLFNSAPLSLWLGFSLTRPLARSTAIYKCREHIPFENTALQMNSLSLVWRMCC